MSASHSRLTEAEEAELKRLGGLPCNQLTDLQNSRLDVLYAKRRHARAEVVEKRAIIGLSIATLVLFYLAIDAGIHDYKRFNKANSVVTGRVVELQEDHDEDGPSRSAHYQFNVNGIYYDGWVGNWDQSLAKGDPIQVCYNASDPNLNHAEGDAPEKAFFRFTFFGIICLIATFAMVRERRKESRKAFR